MRTIFAFLLLSLVWCSASFAANTANKNYNNQTTGTNSGTWGIVLNSNFSLIDNNLGGTLNVDISGSSGGTYSVSLSQAQYIFQNLTGALGATTTYRFPANGGVYFVTNDTTGGHNVIVSITGGGSTVTVPPGGTSWIGVDAGSLDVFSINALQPANNLSDVANTATSLANLGGAPLNSPTFTGTPSLPTGTTGVTQSVGDNSTKLATTAYVDGTFAPLASPTFTGTPSLPTGTTAVTQSPGNNTTKLATTAFVQAAVTGTSLVLPTTISGLLPTSISGTSTTAAITVSGGYATDSTNATVIDGHTGYSWAVSNGNVINGFSGGTTLPSTATIHMYLCSGNSGTGTYAVTNASYPLSAGSCPAGYTTYARRIFSFNTAASTNGPIPYTPIEVEGGAILAWLHTQVMDINGASQGISRTFYTLTVPSGIKVSPLYRTQGSTSGSTVIFTSGDETDIAPTTGGASNLNWQTVPGADMGEASSALSGFSYPRDGRLTTNTSGQIGARSSQAANTIFFVTRGFEDWRRN